MAAAMTHKVAMFDLGGVVVDVESDRLIHHVSQVVGRSYDDVHEVVYNADQLLPLERGQLSPHQYYLYLKERLNLTWTYDQFVRSWNDIMREKKDVTAIIRRLKGRVRLMVLSNTNVLHLEYIRQLVPVLNSFEHVIGSYEVGVCKPDPEIYKIAVDRAQVDAAQVVYIDDRPEMVAGGQRAGLHAIRFENSQQLEKELRSLSILE